MNELELNFMFKVAEERGIDPLTVFESLHFNGRHIYVHFLEDQIGIIEAPDGVDEGDDTLTYQIRAGMIKPLAPDSRVELADALGEKLDKKELKIRIPLDDSESKYLGNLYIKAIENNNMYYESENLSKNDHPQNMRGHICTCTHHT